VLKIEVLGADPAHAISGNYLVEPDGKVDLGPFYAKVSVSNLSLEEAEASIGDFLKKKGFSQLSVSVSLAGWVTKWLDDSGMKAPFHLRPLQLLKIRVAGADAAHPLWGDYVIEPGGKINLGPAYRRIAVGGLTLEEAQQAIEKHLRALGFQAPTASVTLAGWESDWQDLTKQGAKRSGELPPKSGGRPDSLSYGNKTFAEWRATLMSDLKPEVRIEAIKALSAFAPNGYGKDAAQAPEPVRYGARDRPVAPTDRGAQQTKHPDLGPGSAPGHPRGLSDGQVLSCQMQALDPRASPG